MCAGVKEEYDGYHTSLWPFLIPLMGGVYIIHRPYRQLLPGQLSPLKGVECVVNTREKGSKS